MTLARTNIPPLRAQAQLNYSLLAPTGFSPRHSLRDIFLQDVLAFPSQLPLGRASKADCESLCRVARRLYYSFITLSRLYARHTWLPVDSGCNSVVGASPVTDKCSPPLRTSAPLKLYFLATATLSLGGKASTGHSVHKEELIFPNLSTMGFAFTYFPRSQDEPIFQYFVHDGS